MRVLCIHSAEFSYIVRERVHISVVEDAEVGESYQFENCLVIFTSVEKGDIAKYRDIKKSFTQDITTTLDKVKARSVLLYPYAHLSSNLSSPRNAVWVLKGLEKELKKLGLEVHKSPFGWYKEFRLHCLGHPLSELSRTF